MDGRQTTMRKPFFARWANTILAMVALLSGFLFYGAHLAIKSNSNKVEDWLPDTFQETKELAWFRKHFVSDQFVIISWEGCTLGGDPNAEDAEPDDPRIEQLANILVPPEDAGEQEDPRFARYFKSVTTARRVVGELTSPPSNVKYKQAVERLMGSLLGQDGKQTCLVVTLTDEAVGNLRDAVGRGVSGPLRVRRKPGILIQALAQCGVDPSIARLGGPPVDNVSIDEEGERTLVRLAGLAGLFGLGLSWWSLRNIWLTMIVFACGVLSAAGSLAIVAFCGASTDAVLMSMPALVYVLAISGSVHIINYYRDAVDEHGIVGAPERALAHGWKAASLCSLTTALGLVSLYWSALVPIRKFGVYSAAGVMATLAVLFVYLPAALQFWPEHPKKNRGPKAERQPEHDSQWAWFWNMFGGWIIRRYGLVSFGCVAVIALVGAGLTRTRTSINLMELFNPKARILLDYTWLEQHLGRLVPMEVVLRFPKETQLEQAAGEKVGYSFLERMEAVDLVQRTIEHQFGEAGTNEVGRSMSAATFAPPLPAANAGFTRRSATNLKLKGNKAGFHRAGFYRVDEESGAELWRVSIRVAAFQNIDYGTFVGELRRAVDPIMVSHRIRSHVLEKLREGQEEEGFGNAPVLIWHAGDPDELGDSVGAARQTLAESLRELLTKAQLNAREPIHFEDPKSIPISALESLKSFASVILIGDFDAADIEMIERVAGPRIVDASTAQLDLIAPRFTVGSEGNTEIAAVYTGVVPIVYKAQRALLDSLIQSTVWSFLTITPLMMLVSRSFLAGLVVMLPNVLPVLVVFGGMGWLNIKIDIGSMMSASIALGVAVDDTIHFLTWYREDLDRLHDRPRAILTAYRRCATPTLQAALISGLGLSVFGISTFTPTQRFGWLMMTILIAGVVAELIMLPALLAGPLGRVFRARHLPPTKPQLPHGPVAEPHMALAVTTPRLGAERA